MPSAPRRAPAIALLVALLAGVATARDEKPRAAPPAPEPTADEVKALGEKYRAEREGAIKAQFPPEALAKADDLAKRAEAALASGNPRAAARHYRDARWQVPYLPVNLPPHVVRVLGESRMRHPDRVNCVAYSPDGARLASASKDGTVKVWQLGNGRELVTYRGHADQPDDLSKEANVLKVGGVAFHPRENLVASVGGTQVHLWDPDTGKQVKVLASIEKSDKPLKCLAFSPDGTALAVGGDDGILRVYDLATGKATFTSPSRTARIERVAYSPNGKLIAVADNQGKAAVYAPGAKNTMPLSTGVVEGSGGECLGVAFAANGSAIFTCGRDGTARLIAGPNPDGTAAGNTATVLTKFVGHTGAVTDLAVTPDGKFLVTGGEDRTVRVWEVTTAKQLRSFQGHIRLDNVTSSVVVAVRPDGRQIASGGSDGAIRLWDLSATDDHRALTEATEPIWAVAVSPDGKRVAAAGADRTIRVYDPESGKLEATLTGHAAAVTALAFLPDGNRLVSAGGDRVLKVWDVGAKKVIKDMPGHELPVLSVAASTDGKLVVSGATDGTVRGWDPEAGKHLWTWAGRSKAVAGVSIRAGGKQVAAGTADGQLVVLDISGSTPKEVSSQAAHLAGVAAVAYSPDGSKLATAGGDGILRVWTLSETGQPVHLHKFDGQSKPNTPAGFSPLSAVAFSPDGRFAATTGADAVVRVWDVQTKAEVRGLRGHTDWATAVAFASDARFIVSGGADRAVRVFELAPQEGAGSSGHLLAVNAVAVSPDGKLIATASVDHTIKVWERASGREVATLIGSTDEPYAVTFLGPDRVVMGGRVDVGGSGRVHFWEVRPARLLNTLQAGEVYTVAAVPDGSKVAAWSARVADGDQERKRSTYEVFDANAKPLVSFADKGSKVNAATFSADLTLAAAGDEQGVVRVFDLAKKERLKGDWPLFANPVGDLGLTPDKRLLVAIDRNGLVKVADADRRETLTSVPAHKAGVRGLLVSPKGDTFVTLGLDREVKAWSLADPKAVKEVRSWRLPVGLNGAAYAPDGKGLVTANADGTAYVLELP